ncbi:MAG: Ig-like domain-containing protein [Rubrobacter sp.]|nr:Ig-like domain-containing protein [Rubrobacter sp.]
MVAAGEASRDFALSRYNPDGSLDTSFDGDGKLTTAFGSGGSLDVAEAAAIQPDGKILAAGYTSSGSFDFALARYNSDGSLDTSFDGDGKLTNSVGPGNAFDSAHDVAVQPDGKIIVVGWSHDYNTDNTDMAVVRYNPDGSLDNSFDGDGKLTADFDSGKDRASSVALQPDGKIVAGGSSQNGAADEESGNANNDFALARYNPNGSLDTAFSEDGVLTTPIGSFSDTVRDLALQPDGKIVVAGTTQTEDSGAFGDFALARYNPDGSLDPLFGAGGKSITAFTGIHGNEYGYSNAVALQESGKIFVAGRLRQKFALARFHGGDDVTGPDPVSGMQATTQASDISLSWTNPADDDFEATRVMRSTVGHADSATQATNQTKIYEGSATSYADIGLEDNTRYYYTAFARDNNGNWSEAATKRATVDSLPPEAYIISGPASPTNNDTPTFAFEGADNLTPGEDLLYSHKMDGGEWSSYSSETNVTLGGAEGLEDGSHTFYVKAKDEAGNATASPAQRSFTVDTRGPEITIASGPSGTVSAGAAAFEFSADEDADLQCRLDDPQFYNCGSPQKFTGLGLGEHTFKVQGTDQAGNTGSIASRTWTIAPDTVEETVQSGGTATTDPQNNGTTPDDPVATAVTTPNGGSVSITETPVVGASPSGYSLLGQQVDITAPDATASDPLILKFRLDASLIPEGANQNTVQVFRNGTQVENCGGASGTASPDPCVSERKLLADGDIEFTILTSKASRWNFGVDTTKPRITATAPKCTKVAPTANAVATFSEAMRASTINKTTVKLVKRGTRTAIPATVSYNAATRKATLNPTRNLAFGTFYTVTVTTGARDLAGNPLAANKTWTFKVKPRPRR